MHHLRLKPQPRAAFFPLSFYPTGGHAGQLCAGIQIHTDNSAYNHARFKPYRIAALLLKAVRLEYPDYELWRAFPYEYETERLAIDLLSGGVFLRDWVDDASAFVDDFDIRLLQDEEQWAEIREPYLMYG